MGKIMDIGIFILFVLYFSTVIFIVYFIILLIFKTFEWIKYCGKEVYVKIVYIKNDNMQYLNGFKVKEKLYYKYCTLTNKNKLVWLVQCSPNEIKNISNVKIIKEKELLEIFSKVIN